MQAARPYVLAAAALAATSVVVATPLVVSRVGSEAASRVAQPPPVKSYETQLVDESIFNIPFNLFQDIANIPYNEVQALDTLADSEFFTGNWFVVSATNLWGVDPGDPSHFMAVTDLLLPFPALSGLGASETDFSAGLGQQLWGFVAAELPVSSFCDADACIPQVPTPAITGITSIDSLIWDYDILTGQQQFPLIDSWIQVSLNDLLDGYTFSPALNGSTDPSGPVVAGFGFDGTGAGDSMPWSGDTYTLEPWVPVENFINSLMATPDYSAFEIPSLTDIAQAFQAVLAGGLVDFDFLTPGSPFCPSTCDIPDALNYPALVQDVSNLFPNNPIISEWLADYNDPTGGPGITYNDPTVEQIENSIRLLQQGYWDFGNPNPAPGTGPDYTDVSTFFHQLWTDFGIQPLEGVGAGGPDSTQMAMDNYALLETDLSTVLTSLGAPADFTTSIAADITAFEDFNPLTDLINLFGAF